jgi:hypothetical protein
MKRPNRAAEFPWPTVAIALLLGVPTFIMPVSPRHSWSNTRVPGPCDRAVDIAVAAVLAVAFGAVAIVCFLRRWMEVRVWREHSVGVR